jgi:hypothetical protein
MRPSRSILRGTFRLSLVAAAIAAAYTSFNDWNASVERSHRNQEMIRVLECGARLPEERLKAAVNAYGNIDLGKVGCADRQFFASFGELREARDGTLQKQSWLIGGPSINVTNSIYIAIGTLVGVNLLGLFFLGSRAVVIWILDGFRRGA